MNRIYKTKMKSNYTLAMHLIECNLYYRTPPFFTQRKYDSYNSRTLADTRL